MKIFRRVIFQLPNSHLFQQKAIPILLFAALGMSIILRTALQ